MKKISIREAAIACGGEVKNLRDDGDIRGAAIDSRKVLEGDMFVAIKGENTDGHKYISQAEDMGCSCVLMDNIAYLSDAKGPVILVEDTVTALQEIAKAYRRMLDIKIIGVTGSVGKTSTSDMIKAVCDSRYRTVKTPGNYNNHIGLPLTIMSFDRDTQVGILEMGMNNAGEIHKLADIARPDIAVITNIGISHIENLGSRGDIFKAKMEITDFFNQDSVLIVDGEDDFLKYISGKDYRVVKVGGEHIYRYENPAVLGENGISFDYVYGDKTTKVDMGVVGLHNAKNASLALTAGLAIGIDPEEAKLNLRAARLTGNRLMIKTAGDIKVIDDTYNASPASMFAAIDVLMQIEGGRKVAILGDMFELGKSAKDAHRGVGEYAKEKGVDQVICIGSHAWDIYKGVGKDGVYFKTKEDLYIAFDQLIRPGDVVLVKGSNGMHMDKIVKRIVDGNDD